LYGTLGPPADVWKIADYWTHKSHPADYISRMASSGKRETLNLARAALAHIEDAIDTELVTITRALQSRLLTAPSSTAEDVFFCALDHAYKTRHIRQAEHVRR
jgi:hypothetical protein